MEIKINGSQSSVKGPSDWFTGAARIDPLFQAPDPALVSCAEQLRFHLRKALEDGVNKGEVIARLAFYAGWPNPMSAIMIAKELFSKA